MWPSVPGTAETTPSRSDGPGNCGPGAFRSSARPSSVAIRRPEAAATGTNSGRGRTLISRRSARRSCRAYSTGSATELCLIEPSCRPASRAPVGPIQAGPVHPVPDAISGRKSPSDTGFRRRGHRRVGRSQADRSGNTVGLGRLCRFNDRPVPVTSIGPCPEPTRPRQDAGASSANGADDDLSIRRRELANTRPGICPIWPTLKCSRHASKLNEISQEDTDVRRPQSGTGQGP